MGEGYDKLIRAGGLLLAFCFIPDEENGNSDVGKGEQGHEREIWPAGEHFHCKG